MIARKLVVVLMILLAAGCGRAKGKYDKVEIKKLKNGHYQLLVNKQPYIIKGVCYAPVPIGKSHLFNFMCDPARPWIEDGRLMKEMGVNTVRLYMPGEELEFCKGMIEDLYNLYGIRTILGHGLGFWGYPPANYADPEFRQEITDDVVKVVNYFKDTPGLLMWNLGNENNYSFDGRLNPWSSDEIDAIENFNDKQEARARIYYTFINDLVKEIKKIDKVHPVALGNGETIGLKSAALYCPDVDFIGAIVYRGKVFGSFFKEIKRKFDKPVVLTEFGCDAYNMATEKEDQNSQAQYIKSQWQDIQKHLANNEEGMGNCLGGAIFEWSDEWWKTSDSDRDSWWVHDTHASWGMGSYAFDAKAGKNMNEEWFGLVGLSPEMENGINKRIPRKAYYVLRQLWNEEYIKAENEEPK